MSFTLSGLAVAEEEICEAMAALSSAETALAHLPVEPRTAAALSLIRADKSLARRANRLLSKADKRRAG